MGPNENTKSGPEQNQPDVIQQESPRVCKICGGPNHHGCGCEAKAAREWPGEDAPPDVQPAEPTGPQPTEPTGPQPAEPKPAETAVDYYSKKFLEGLEEYASDNMLSILSYLSNIDQHVKEIHAMVKARIRQDAGENKN